MYCYEYELINKDIMKQIFKFLQNIDNLVSYIFSNNSKEDLFLKKFFNKKK